MEKLEIKEIKGVFEFWGDLSGLPAYPRYFRGEIILKNGEVLTEEEINGNEKLFFSIAYIITNDKIEIIY